MRASVGRAEPNSWALKKGGLSWFSKIQNLKQSKKRKGRERCTDSKTGGLTRQEAMWANTKPPRYKRRRLGVLRKATVCRKEWGWEKGTEGWERGIRKSGRPGKSCQGTQCLTQAGLINEGAETESTLLDEWGCRRHGLILDPGTINWLGKERTRTSSQMGKERDL